MNAVLPPKFADLEWTENAAIPTDAFWAYWNWNSAHATIRQAGIRISKPADKFIVTFDPSLVTGDLASLIATADEKLAAAREQWSRSMAVQQAGEMKRQQIRDVRAAERGDDVLRAEPHRIAAQKAGLDCIARWGEFACRKQRLRALSTAPCLTFAELNELTELFRRTEVKAAERKAKAEALGADGMVDWPDETIVAAIEFLTDLDDDYASNRNNAGWSAGDTSTGHWCYAMLPVDRGLAIKMARSIVGRYRRQLSLIISDEAA